MIWAVNINFNTTEMGRVRREPLSSAKSERPAGGETEAFKGVASLENALQETPDVRPDKVARGRQLIADPHYPPPEIMQRVAQVLAPNIQRSED